MRLTLELDLSRVHKKLTDTVLDLDLLGLGPDGATSYSVKSATIGQLPKIPIEIEVEHLEGKFVSKEELIDAVVEVISIELDV